MMPTMPAKCRAVARGRTNSLPGPARGAPRTGARPVALDRLARAVTAIGLAVWITTLAGCGPPTDVIAMQGVSPETRNAMLKLPVVPVGLPGPAGVGSVGPVEGFGCGRTPEEAGNEAIQQLQVKAMRRQATAVTQVLIEPASAITCNMPYGAMARGIAVAPRGVPPTY